MHNTYVNITAVKRFLIDKRRPGVIYLPTVAIFNSLLYIACDSQK